MSKLTNWLAAGTAASLLPLVSASAESVFSNQDLVGTIWATEAPFEWTRVDGSGNITVTVSDGHSFEVLDFNGGVFAIKIHWWSVKNDVSVVEYGVMVESRDNSFTYAEVDHAEDSRYPGIHGEGFFRVVDADNAEVFQLGNLLDGSAGAFSIKLVRAEEATDTSIPVTHPAPQ
ncbi:MAG: hypothetical protein GY798_16070 [Hyphomicrobiales bacterium]|nr:hypothetical protein [Hyphomicrobiales bacterium]